MSNLTASEISRNIPYGEVLYGKDGYDYELMADLVAPYIEDAINTERERCAELIMTIDNTFLGPQYREKLAKSIRSGK